MANKKPDPVEFIKGVIGVKNIAENLDSKDLARIADDALREYKLDKDSMSEWFEQMNCGLKLAKLVRENRNYPFKGSSNVKYPLITSAALQFNARAYPAICAPNGMVKTRTHGEDPEGAKAARGERVSAHMSWQLSSQMPEWEEQTDKLLVQLPIVGEMFRKFWYDGSRKRTVSRLVEPGRLIVNDKVKSLQDAPRCSEEIDLYPIDIVEREREGLFLKIDYDDDSDDTQKLQMFIEQHRRIDLDGDGYEEPYIVTIHKETEKVVRIVADFEEHDVNWETERVMIDQPTVNPETNLMEITQVEAEIDVGVSTIERGSYFVDYQMMPGMDGGFHGTGLGFLLGDISESINSIMNMLLDSGHMSTLGGGFIGNGLRLKGGAQRFEPGEWRMVGANGQDIRNAIVPLTFPQPDAVLFQMLGMLIEAGREIASVKDIMTGDSGEKNMTATTTLALIEQGMMVFTAAYKRIFRSLKKEFALLAALNAETVTVEEYNQFHDGELQFDPAQDYSAFDMDIEPVADPQSVTKMQKAAKAQFLMELSKEGVVDPVEASKRMLEATDIEDVEELAPKPNPMEAQMAEMQMQLEGAKVQADGMKAQADTMKAEAEMLKAQTPVDNSADVMRTQTDERMKMAELEAKMQLEREKMAQDAMLEREKIMADLQARQLEIQAQMATAGSEESGREEGRQDLSAVVSGFGELIQAMQAQLEMANGPKRVIRDENGQVTGVEPVLN